MQLLLPADSRVWNGLVCVAILALLAPLAVAADEVITPREMIALFNGKDLSNFYTWLVDHRYEDPDRVFSVVDYIDGAPALRVSGEHWGGFATRERFKDYRLVVEFRWGPVTWGERARAARDSGILMHCQGPDGNTSANLNGPWMRSVETQIIEGGVGDFILVAGFDAEGNRMVPQATARVQQDRDGEWAYDPWSEPRPFTGGRINWYARDPDWEDVLGFRGKSDVESPFGEWTRIEVICRGNQVTNIVNGRTVNRLSDSTLTEGKIMFQSEGAETFFRRIELHPLP
jgi:hypothetical protein